MRRVEYAECARCRTFYIRYRPEQRFCGNTCARYADHHGEDMDPLQALADRCAKFISYAGTVDGVTPRDLDRYVHGYASLTADERFRVNVLICKVKGMAFVAEDDDFRYWPRDKAPEGAVRA